MPGTSRPESPGGSIPVSIAVAVVLTGGLLLRLALFTGPLGSDDTRYLEFAAHFVRLQPFETLDHAAGRLVFLVLVGIPYVLGGQAGHAALANVLFAFLTDIAVTLFVFRAFGPKPALIAAILMGLNATHMVFASTVLPDTLLSFFMFLSVAVVHRALREERLRARLFLIAAAGLIAGLAYGCKETGVLLLPPVLAILVLAREQVDFRSRLLAPLVFVAAFAAFWVADALVYFAFTGDPFYKITATAAVHNATRASASGIGEHLGVGLGHLAGSRHSWQFVLLPLYLGTPAMLAVALFDSKSHPQNPSYRLFALVGLFVSGFLIFGTSSLTSLVALPFQPRYLQPVIPFAVLSLAALAHLHGSLERTGVLAPLAAASTLLMLVSGLGGASRLSGHMYLSGMYKQMAIAAQSLPEDDLTLYVDARAIRDLHHFLPPGFTRTVERVPSEGPLGRGYYMLHPQDRYRRGVDAARRKEIAETPVQLRLSLDLRPIRSLRPGASHRGLPPLTVHLLAGDDVQGAPIDMVVEGSAEGLERR